jgi:hypothetical protein
MKLDYNLLAVEEAEGDRKWWWSFVWTYHALLKVQILSWLVLENKILAWEKK